MACDPTSFNTRASGRGPFPDKPVVRISARHAGQRARTHKRGHWANVRSHLAAMLEAEHRTTLVDGEPDARSMGMGAGRNWSAASS
jgi:hypothetical protein